MRKLALFLLLSGCWVGGATGGGGGDGGGTGDGGNPTPKPTQCTSGVTVTSEDLQNRNLMHPGRACNACHDTQKPPQPHFSIAGTVYATDGELDDCTATSAVDGVTVVVTDMANNVLWTVPVQTGTEANSTPSGKALHGNFALEGVTPPAQFRVKVVSADKQRERAMGATPASGDCNSCHTAQGASGAPGRILAP